MTEIWGISVAVIKYNLVLVRLLIELHTILMQKQMTQLPLVSAGISTL